MPTRPEGHLAVDRLAATLGAHRPRDDREAASRATMVAELCRLHHPFDEDADPVHVTVSAIVVGCRGIVLHEHRRLHRWMQPGGHVEPGELPEEAALRECKEETGLSATHPLDGPAIIHVDVHPAAKGHVHLDLRYLVAGPDEDPTPAPGESQAVAWCTWEAAAAVADEALAGAVRSARRLVGDIRGGTPSGAEEARWASRSRP